MPVLNPTGVTVPFARSRLPSSLLNAHCSGLIKPDTKLGGKIKPSNEVNNDNRSSEFYSRI